MREDIAEIKHDVKSLNERQAEFERHYTGEHVKVAASAEAAHSRLDRLEPRVEKLEESLRCEVQRIRDALSPLTTQAKLIVWVASALGLSIIALLWSIIIGKAEVVFR